MPRNFIIIDPDPIVSMDLEEMLLLQFPDGGTVTFSADDGFANALDVIMPDTTVFVRGALFVENETVARTVRAAAASGSAVVILGESRGVDIAGQVVDLPFTNETISQKIASLTPMGKPSPEGGELH